MVSGGEISLKIYSDLMFVIKSINRHKYCMPRGIICK